MPPTFRAAILRLGQRNLSPPGDQVAGMLPQTLSRLAAIRTRRMLADFAGVAGQLLYAHFAGHQVANPNHRVFDVIDILILSIESLRLLVRQQLCYQRLNPFFFRNVFLPSLAPLPVFNPAIASHHQIHPPFSNTTPRAAQSATCAPLFSVARFHLGTGRAIC